MTQQESDIIAKLGYREVKGHPGLYYNDDTLQYTEFSQSYLDYLTGNYSSNSGVQELSPTPYTPGLTLYEKFNANTWGRNVSKSSSPSSAPVNQPTIAGDAANMGIVPIPNPPVQSFLGSTGFAFLILGAILLIVFGGMK